MSRHPYSTPAGGADRIVRLGLLNFTWGSWKLCVGSHGFQLFKVSVDPWDVHALSVLHSYLLTYLLSPLRACSHIRPTPRNAIVVCPLPALRPGPNSTRVPSSLAPRTFSTSLLVVPSSCFRRGSSAWLLLE